MAFSILVKRIGTVKKYNSNAYMNSILHEAKWFCETEVLPMYEKGVENWQPEHKPDFIVEQFVGSRDIAFRIGTNSEDYDVYRYVDQGTDIRWALMSSDWISKTSPRRYWSQDGAGEVLIRGMRAMMRHGLGPRPGVQPRDFTGQIVKIIQPVWRKWMREAARRASIDMEMESWKV